MTSYCYTGYMHGLDVDTLIKAVGLPGIALIIFIESGFPFGFFLPGDTLLFAAGLFAAQGHFHIVLAILIIFASNFIGVTLGYMSGKVLGKRYLKEEEKETLTRNYVKKAESFYARHGGKAIILGRFVPAVRSFVPLVAGVANMNYNKLMFYNAIGAALWATSIPLLGYFAGGWLKSIGIDVDMLVLPIIGLIIVLSLLGPIVHALHDKETRKKLLGSILRRK